ncbi:MAG: amidohydrolase [Candidatus Electrothrix aestuarii]|uniref:5-methylthioadenosine/S-adenosylhomocysteine deaminase n=1 Tax=Candidatus Electrothrix aestuarii TaxID=3062594 RepID=A0AAU8LQ03_9BACT|nr:amidohydrolase [Candidatus Electrothrix aestuarii]
MCENNPANIHLILSGRYLVAHSQEVVEQENISVALAGDSIVEVGVNLAAKYPQAECLSHAHGLIMPGLINTHTHAAMSCFRGLADDLPLMEWLQENIFPREAQLTSEIVYHSTLLSLCEMIKSGTTSFNDMYLFVKDVARAAAESGMRAWLGEVLYDFPSPNYGELENGFTYTEELFEQYAQSELVTVTVNPHSVYTCAPALLERLATQAEEKDALYHIHLSENQDEVNTCMERYGCSPVQHLEKLGLLNERVVAAHGVMVSEEEIDLLVERKVKVAHCPESNMKLASGVAPIPAMLAKGMTVGLGTDGSASNNDVDLFGEMNSAAKMHKVARMDPAVMTAAQTLHAATLGGAALLGVEKEIGSIAVGKKADLIMLDMDQPHLTPVYNPVSHLVYAAGGGDVIHSVINGQVVMRDRKLTTLDEAAILTEMKRIGEEVQSMG